MTWVGVDDSAPLHKKFFRSGLTAYGWFVAALCYCNRFLTDGFIPAKDAALVFPGTPQDLLMAVIQALVQEHTLHVVKAGVRTTCHNKSRNCPTPVRQEDGWSVHDFFVHQPSKIAVIRKRRENSIRGRKGAEIRWKSHSQPPSPEHSQGHISLHGPTPTPTPKESKQLPARGAAPTDDPHRPRRLIDEHARRFTEKTGSVMVVSYPRDCKRVKPIIDAHGIEKALDLNRQFFSSDTGWWVRKNAWNLGAFVSAINDLAAQNGHRRLGHTEPLFPRRMAEEEKPPQPHAGGT